jgi:tetratricopeptide (TPR) repeat protein
MTQLTIDPAMQLALEHHKAGRIADAERIYRQVLTQQPANSEALHLLGVLAHQNGRLDTGIELIQRAIAISPSHAHYHNNLGNVLRAKGLSGEAITAYRKAVQLKPDYPEAYYNLGIALRDTGQLDEAVAAYRKAVHLKPDYAAAENNMGNALREKGLFDEAITAFRRALRLDPDKAETYNNFGATLREKGLLDDAVATLGQAIRLKPDFVEAYYNLGSVLWEKECLDEAIAAYRQAIRLKPGFIEAYADLGTALREKGLLDEAIMTCRQALRLKPDCPQVHDVLSSVLLLKGDFLQGWTEYEWRWRRADYPAPRGEFAQPRWDGAPLNGRTILLHAEGGFGDTLQFVRYSPMVAARGGRVVLECQEPLRRLLEGFAGIEQLITTSEPLPHFDVHCPMMSLPSLFGTKLETIPSTIPYLRSDPALVDSWKGRVGASDGKLKVGITWGGSRRFRRDRTRSLRLEQLATLADVPGVRFYSLQKGTPGEDAKELPPRFELTNLGPELEDFSDTAAVMSFMDIIISTDTSVAHLAGALGRPVWVMLQFMPDWRWLLEREYTPWYPTMRLFRQKRFGDWDEVIDRVAKALDLLRIQENHR